MTRSFALVLLPMLGAAAAARAQANDPSSAKPAHDTATAGDSRWLGYDAATNTATFQLEAGTTGAKSPFNFDGYTDGEATLVVPPKTRVVINFVNEDGTPHSAEIISGQGPLPNIGGDPAIPGAYTRDVTQGLAEFAKDVLRFTAPESGTYRIICGVPGHALSGMWIWFKIDPQAMAPSFGPTKS